MRSITFTRHGASALALLGGILGTVAQAEPLLPPGCYARNYDAGHLARHPDQIVERFFLAIRYDAEYDTTLIPLTVTLADQGRARDEGVGGHSYFQTLYCFSSNTAGSATDARLLCGVECDGGNFEVMQADGDILELRTDYVMVGDTEFCGGAFDLAEIRGEPVTYRLNRVEDALCDEVFE